MPLIKFYWMVIWGHLCQRMGFQTGQEDALLASKTLTSKSLKRFAFLSFHRISPSLFPQEDHKALPMICERCIWASGLRSCFTGTITIVIIIIVIAVMGPLFCLSDSIWPISLHQELLLYYFSPLHSKETMSGRGIC